MTVEVSMKRRSSVSNEVRTTAINLLQKRLVDAHGWVRRDNWRTVTFTSVPRGTNKLIVKQCVVERHVKSGSMWLKIGSRKLDDFVKSLQNRKKETDDLSAHGMGGDGNDG